MSEWKALSRSTRTKITVGAVAVLMLFLIVGLKLLAGLSDTPAYEIEQVLTADAAIAQNAHTFSEVVAQMRAIQLDRCPPDFREAYLAHVHAWERVLPIERAAAAYQSNANSGEVAAEAFVRGMLGDPLGKMNELNAERSAIQSEYAAVNEEARVTFNRVEEIAVRYGAKLPKKSLP